MDEITNYSHSSSGPQTNPEYKMTALLNVYHKLTRDFPNHKENILHGLIFPRVYASDVSSEQVSPVADSKATAIDRIITPPRPQGNDRRAVSDAEIQLYLDDETGKERLRMLFTKPDIEDCHPDLIMPVGTICGCSFITFILGGALGAASAKQRFIKKNLSTKWETKLIARRAIVDAMFIGAFKVGSSISLRTSLFTTIFMMSSQCIATYRNQSSLIEYMAAGALTGSVLRINLGIRGFVAGAAIGLTLGGIGGAAMLLLLYAGGETQQVRHYWHIREILQNKRDAQLLQGQAQPEQADIVQPS